MPFFETVLLFAIGLIYMLMFGYPVVKLLLPKDLYDEYGHVIALPVGYLMLCLTAFLVSGSFLVGAPAEIGRASCRERV